MMGREPIPQPLTIDGTQLAVRHESRIRELLDLLSSDQIAILLEAKAALDDARLSDDRIPLVHGSTKHDYTVGGCPIGSIIAWHKDLTGTPALPDGWAECNAQTISDPASPYDGVTLPGLNSGYAMFLRGTAGSPTGTPGGSLSHSHVT